MIFTFVFNFHISFLVHFSNLGFVIGVKNVILLIVTFPVLEDTFSVNILNRINLMLP